MPAWLAVIEQVPAPASVTRFPATVQTPVVVEAKLTGRPDDADASSVTFPEPNATLPRALNVIVWET